MIRKTKHQKTTRVAREKASALRRESAETKLQVSILKNDAHVESLIRELGELIEDAQRQVAVTANAALTTLYWQVGRVQTRTFLETAIPGVESVVGPPPPRTRRNCNRVLPVRRAHFDRR
jgi:hypothetical protein